jgi:two-component system response regulator AtoC
MEGKPSILIVGDEAGVAESVRTLGFRPVVVGRPQEALTRATRTAPSLVLINLPDPAAESTLLRELYREGRPILILTDPDQPRPDIGPTNARIRILTRPVRDEELHAALHAALRAAHTASRADEGTGEPREKGRYHARYAQHLSHSPAMQAIGEIIERIADTNTTVLVRGESGAGKELVAHAIHHASQRSHQPFVKVNCAALPAELLESELFGHEKGAFTGAYRRKLGKFEFANKGTLFLDEIGELPLALQAKLLHVLQDHEFSRLGGRETIRVDTRVIASTNRDLEAALSTGQFREDLYYRLNVVEIRVPPLRERREEIPRLVTYFLEKFQQQYGRQVKLAPDSMERLAEYSWPGNVRELENIVRRLVVLGTIGQVPAEIFARLQARPSKPSDVPGAGAPHASLHRLDPSVGLREIARRAAREAERRAIAEVLDRVHWNRTKAARLLKISYKTLLTKIAECGLGPKQQRLRA